MKTKSNKRKFANVQSPFNLGEIATSETGADCILLWSWLINPSWWKQLSLAKMWLCSAYLGMTQICLFYLHIGWIRQSTDGALGWISTWLTCHLGLSLSEMLAVTMYACAQWLWFNFLFLRQRKCLIDIPLIQSWWMQQCFPRFHYSQPPVTSMKSTCYYIFTKKEKT